VKPIKVNGSIIGVTVNGETTYIAAGLADMDAAARKQWLLPETTRGSMVLERLFETGRALIFAVPLTFSWEARLNGKRRIIAVKQADLGLTTMADPASLLDDIAYEVHEVYRMSGIATYARNPVTAVQAAKTRALVRVEVLR
jgi:hypothetical protein